MKQDLIQGLAPKLRALDRGGYARSYGKGRTGSSTGTRTLVVQLLDSLKIPFQADVRVSGPGGLTADFLVNGTFVFVDRDLSEAEKQGLSKSGADCVIIDRNSLRSDRADHGIRVIGLGESGARQTIFLDDPSFNFDYAHILPKTQKCSVMHGHTSSVLVEVIGRPVEGMVVDFGDAKRIVKAAVAGLDHKLFINQRYVTAMDDRTVSLSFETAHGPFAIKAPRQTTVLLGGEATVENLAKEVLDRVAPKMPENVTAVGVYIYEGLNKGSHILAKIHQGGVGKRRKKR